MSAPIYDQGGVRVWAPPGTKVDVDTKGVRRPRRWSTYALFMAMLVGGYINHFTGWIGGGQASWKAPGWLEVVAYVLAGLVCVFALYTLWWMRRLHNSIREEDPAITPHSTSGRIDPDRDVTDLTVPEWFPDPGR